MAASTRPGAGRRWRLVRQAPRALAGLIGGCCAATVWTVATIVWLRPSRIAGADAHARAIAVLTTMATIVGAAIVLTLIAGFFAIQMSSASDHARAAWSSPFPWCHIWPSPCSLK